MCDLPVELPYDEGLENCVIRELLFDPRERLPAIQKAGDGDLFHNMRHGIVPQAECPHRGG